jgi:5,6-dimethylbenzimidazole synthase
MTDAHQFTAEEAAAVYRAIALRRDMRHFRPDPVPPEVLARLLQAAHLAPSVGFMQPWRFVRITDPVLRRSVHDLVEAERQRTADELGSRRAEFLRLKVQGILECGELLVVALMDGRDRYVFGRRTLPEMDVASAACAIQNVWLTARVEGLGMGWVSIFDPEALARLLAMPEGARPLAVLCLGFVDEFYERPMLEEQGWDDRRDLADLVGENRWPVGPEGRTPGPPGHGGEGSDGADGDAG